MIFLTETQLLNYWAVNLSRLKSRWFIYYMRSHLIWWQCKMCSKLAKLVCRFQTFYLFILNGIFQNFDADNNEKLFQSIEKCIICRNRCCVLKYLNQLNATHKSRARWKKKIQIHFILIDFRSVPIHYSHSKIRIVNFNLCMSSAFQHNINILAQKGIFSVND